jgi:hypothetical protein
MPAHTGGSGMSPDNSRKTDAPLRPDDFARLVDRANDGDEQSLQELRQVLEYNPILWHALGNLGAAVLESLIRSIAPHDQLIAESIRRKVSELRTALTTEASTPLQELAIERVIACWLRVQALELRCAHLEGGTRGWAGFWTKALAQAQRSYELATKHLLTVRELEVRCRKQSQRRTKSAVPSAGSADERATIPLRRGGRVPHQAAARVQAETIPLHANLECRSRCHS